MISSIQTSKLETTVTQDRKLLFTLASFGLISVIYINLNVFYSPVLGITTSSLYFLINGIFLGHAFFEKETTFFRLIFGILLLIMLLGFFGLLSIIIYNLDVTRFTLVLFIAATLSSLLNRRMKSKNATK
jgi:uncharacterized membrane protein YdcZ (DUF606 family)